MRKFIMLVAFLTLFCSSVPVLALDAPTLTVTTSGINVSVSWTSVPYANGYTLYYAPSDISYIEEIDMGTNTSLSVDLWDGAAFYVAVTATDGFEMSGYSNVELFQISAPTNEAIDFSGTYEIIITVDATACGEGVYTYTKVWNFIQNGNSISVSGTDYDGDPFNLTGTINGNTISVSGSYNEDSGTTALTANLTVSGNTFSGSISWTWSYIYGSCSGIDQISGVKQ